MEAPAFISSQGALTYFLSCLLPIPIEQIEEGQRTCGICWETYDADASTPFSSPASANPPAWASSYSLVASSPPFENETSSMNDIVVNTEIRVEHEVLVETYTHDQRYWRDEDAGFGDNDPLNSLKLVDQPVRLPCGHIFGRSCLLKWRVFLKHPMY